ncbi:MULTISPECIES: hypothetical protein [unclassified Bradyrhizobium]|uniref:hypothetical protein n=1 Tax=unclassified Bradyrhizobium TaxID=2631580 RepID=UPI0020B3D787|nr:MULTISPECIES: hypothetical protein [unclassified Bradyrhizobium]MCP3397816.1 hypothetical protein [Bradyrhizobium sp. CCGB20]MCP3406404.1 hypothetical protein [Bradyrhizobium sp. CCGB01]
MMSTVAIISNDAEDAVVLFKSNEVLRRDYEQICRRFDGQWETILADHAEAQATIQPGQPKLAKADRRTALLEEQKLLLEEHVSRLQAGNATLAKIAAWLKYRNQAFAEHNEVADRSKRFARRHARFAE